MRSQHIALHAPAWQLAANVHSLGGVDPGLTGGELPMSLKWPSLPWRHRARPPDAGGAAASDGGSGSAAVVVWFGVLLVV